jgi:hypothetical protein
MSLKLSNSVRKSNVHRTKSVAKKAISKRERNTAEPACDKRAAKATRQLKYKKLKLSKLSNFANKRKVEYSLSHKRWKTLNEREVLECYFELDTDWSRKTILYVRDMVQLSEKQIYKWGYEKRRRLNLLIPDSDKKKEIDMKYVTKIKDLNSAAHTEDLNSVIDSLFPEDGKEEETLSDEQREIYDKIREQLIERSEQYEQQSDLEKLLNDRIPVLNVALKAKIEKERSEKESTNLGKGVLGCSKTLIQNKKFTFWQNAPLQKIDFPKLEDLTQDLTKEAPKSVLDLSFRSDCNDLGQIDSEWEHDLKDSYNFTNGRTNTDSFANTSPDQDSQPKILYQWSPLSDATPELNKIFSFNEISELANTLILNICNPIANEDSEWKFESINELCSSLGFFDSDMHSMCN